MIWYNKQLQLILWSSINPIFGLCIILVPKHGLVSKKLRNRIKYKYRIKKIRSRKLLYSSFYVITATIDYAPPISEINFVFSWYTILHSIFWQNDEWMKPILRISYIYGQERGQLIYFRRYVHMWTIKRWMRKINWISPLHIWSLKMNQPHKVQTILNFSLWIINLWSFIILRKNEHIVISNKYKSNDGHQENTSLTWFFHACHNFKHTTWNKI